VVPVDKVVKVIVLPEEPAAEIRLAVALVDRAVLELPAVAEDLAGSGRRPNLSPPTR